MFLSGLDQGELKQILEYLYLGKTSVPQEDVEILLKKAREFEIIGLRQEHQENTGENEYQIKRENQDYNSRKVKSLELNTLKDLVKLQNNMQTKREYNDVHGDKKMVETVIDNEPKLQESMTTQGDILNREVRVIADIIVKEQWDSMTDSEKESAHEQLKFAIEYEPQVMTCRHCRIMVNASDECSHPYGIKTNLKEDYQCQYCSYIGSRRDILNVHLMNNHLGTRYNCDLCEYKTNRPGNWKRHRVLEHSSFSS